MPFQDVTDVLDDPDFFDRFTVIRPGMVPTEQGIPAETDRAFTAFGVVTPASEASLQLLPEGTFQKGAIQIITKFPLQTGAGGMASADIINWHNTNWLVETVADWSGFGVGFYVANASLRDVNPPGEARNA